MMDSECEGRVLEFGSEAEKTQKSLADLTLNHSVKRYLTGGWGIISGIVFENNVVLTVSENGEFRWYDDGTVLNFDLYRLKTNQFGKYLYFIHRKNAEYELEQARIRAKYGKEQWPEISHRAKVELVHLSITPYKMINLDIMDLGCDFVNQRKGWIEFLEDVRKGEE